VTLQSQGLRSYSAAAQAAHAVYSQLLGLWELWHATPYFSYSPKATALSTSWDLNGEL